MRYCREAVRESSEKKLEVARQKLQSSLDSQQQAANDMKRLLGSLSSAQSMVEVQNDCRRILSDQRSLREDTERLQVQSVAGTARTADLDAKRVGLRSDQQNLARSIDEVAAMIATELSKSTSQAEKDQRNSGANKTNGTE